jgi:ABC-type lipoprotein release transport system permease subunit
MNPKFSATYSFGTNPSGNLFVALAWRNLWRNKKRTLISIASIFFAVFLAVIMAAMQSGSWEYMIESTVSMYTGHIQVHGLNYWDKRSLDQSLLLTEREKAVLDSLGNSMVVTYRLETFSLVSHDSVTKITPVVGIDPDRENRLTGLRRRIVTGSYLTPESPGIMLAEGLAKMLNVTINDSIVLYGQGYQGITAAVIIPVTGIVRFPIPDLNNAMSYLSLRNAQNIYYATDRLTSATILVEYIGIIPSVQSLLRSSMNADKEVMTWEEMS